MADAGREERLLRWEVGLLLPFPPLSLLYLLAVRAERLAPRFEPLAVVAVLPLAAAVLGIVALRRSIRVQRQAIMLAAALAEILWALCTLAMLGFAVARRSG